VALNHERAAEEKRGLVRWLRPEFQNKGAGGDVQQEIETLDDDIDDADLARHFKNAKAPRVEEILDTLVALGHARRTDSGYAPA